MSSVVWLFTADNYRRMTGLRFVLSGQESRFHTLPKHLRSIRSQFGAVTPPYFWSHFNSSLTLILPCQGFLSRLWPSRGDQQIAWNIQLVQGAVEEIVLEDGDADVVGSGDHVGRSANFVDLINRGFTAIAIGSFPRQAAWKYASSKTVSSFPQLARCSTAPAPVTAALKRVVWVMSQLVMYPP